MLSLQILLRMLHSRALCVYRRVLLQPPLPFQTTSSNPEKTTSSWSPSSLFVNSDTAVKNTECITI
jgi:hypothetical protein